MKLPTIIAATIVSAHAAYGATFYVMDEATFDGAVTGAGLVNLGTEDFESSTTPTAGYSSVTPPLQPGVANGPFPAGTNAAMGMTIQSNDLGGMPNVTSLGGFLANVPDGFAGTPTQQVGNEVEGESLDLLFSPGIKAIELYPIFAEDNTVTDPNTANPGTVEIRVFDLANTLIGTGSITGITYNAVDHFGIIADPGVFIGRVNLFASTGDFTGADDITVFAANPIPEPTIGLLGLAGAFGMLLHRRRAR